MSDIFREFVKKIGSGPHTGENLTREEAAQATEMMLTQAATPAQIGAFLIAHRIKRPTSAELAGMWDAYDRFFPPLAPLPENPTVTVLGVPYDGRSRLAPFTILTALILATAGVPVLLHGGERMPTKYGLPLVEIWQNLGLDLTKLSLEKVYLCLEKNNLGFIYLPQHFSLAQGLVTYRDQIGKRPPLATLELVWSPYGGHVHLICGYVHPPTADYMQGAFSLRGFNNYTLVKGLEGSCDLPRDRTAIITCSQPQETSKILKLHPHDYGFGGKEVSLESLPTFITQMQETLAGKPSEFLKTAVWNGGFCLWRCGVCDELSQGFIKAESLLLGGKVFQKFKEIKAWVES